MPAKQLRACKTCSRITEEETCPFCGGQTSREFQGYLVIVDWKRSSIASKMNLTENGKYALRVR